MSVRVSSSYFGGSNLVKFFTKVEHYGRSSKSAKIGLSKTIFYDMNYLNLSNIDFHLRNKVLGITETTFIVYIFG